MQSCLDLGNPAITKGHTFALCQACVSPRPVGTLSGVFPPPSLQELSESEAWVGISDRLRLHLLACAYARSFPCGSPPVCLIAVSRASGIVPRPAARAAGGAAPEVVTLLYSFTHKHAPIVWTGDYTRLFSNHLNHPAWVRWSIVMQTSSSSSLDTVAAKGIQSFSSFHRVFSEMRLLLFAGDLLKVFDSRIQKKGGGERGFRETDRRSLL